MTLHGLCRSLCSRCGQIIERRKSATSPCSKIHMQKNPPTLSAVDENCVCENPDFCDCSVFIQVQIIQL